MFLLRFRPPATIHEGRMSPRRDRPVPFAVAVRTDLTDLSSDTLDELRARIDAIDTELHDLLMRRADIVVQVGQVKKAGGSFLRPARESQILRRLAERHHGPLALGSVVRIWREVLSAMTMIQGKFSVAVHLPDGDGAYWDLARDHFGVQPQTVAHLSPGAVLRAVSDDPATVGVLPWPMDGERDPWWRHLCTGDAKLPRIVARLPAIAVQNSKTALVVGQVDSAPSGNDRSFLVIETLAEMSRTRLLSRLGKVGFSVEFITDHADAPGNTPAWTLIEVEGHVLGDDPRLKLLLDESVGEIDYVRVIGGYPVPLPR